MNILAEELINSLQWLELAVDKIRSELMYVCFKQTKGNLQMTSADGYLIFRVTYNLNSNHELDFLLPVYELPKITEFLKSLGEGSNVEFSRSRPGSHRIASDQGDFLSRELSTSGDGIKRKKFRDIGELLTTSRRRELPSGLISLDKNKINKLVIAFKEPKFMFYGDNGPVIVTERAPDELRPKYIGLVMPMKLVTN